MGCRAVVDSRHGNVKRAGCVCVCVIRNGRHAAVVIRYGLKGVSARLQDREGADTLDEITCSRSAWRNSCCDIADLEACDGENGINIAVVREHVALVGARRVLHHDGGVCG